jgi:spermidine/putrescine transport system substrate-binding protein
LSGAEKEDLPMPKYRPRFSLSRRSMLKGSGALALGLTFLPRHSLSAEEKKLNLYNWDTYIGNETLPKFSDTPASK